MPNDQLNKHTLFLFTGDFEKLASFFPDVGASVVIRRIVHEHVKKLEAGISQLPKQLKVEIDD